MREYVIVTEATLDIPQEMVEELGIHVIPMAFVMDGKEYLHYPDERQISNEEFYNKLKEGKMSVTSQINPHTFEEVFRGILEQDKDVLFITFSSGLSGTYQSSLIAQGIMQEEFPEHKIYVIDSICACAGLGFLLYHAVQRQREGMDVDSLYHWILEYRLKVNHWFTVDDLFHLQRGGRLSSVEALVGSALKIKPVLSLSEEGKLYVENKVRGTKKSMEYMVSKAMENADDIENQMIMVAHGAAKEKAIELKQRLIEKTGVKEVVITKVGPIIGTHTGPGMLALVFMGK